MKNLKNFQFLFPQLFINLLFSMSCFASIYPQFAYKPPVSKLELTSGFNFTSIKQIENSNSGTPFLGIRLQMPLNKEFFLETGAELAYFEYSSLTAFPKIRNTYLRFKIVPQFKINNFMKFGAGLQRSFCLARIR